MTQVAVLDYGSGNLRSAVRALARAGAQVELTDDVDRAAGAEALVVPGVGAYASCMEGLRGVGGVDLIRDWAASGKPLLGICVGYQVLFESGTEHGRTTPGCGVLSGEVTRLPARRLPHMGWNTVAVAPGSQYFPDSSDGPDGTGDRYYFVHSYGVADTPVRLTADPDSPVLEHITTHEGHAFVAAVESGSLLATQFHPEKSGDAGAALLRGWVSTVGKR